MNNIKKLIPEYRFNEFKGLGEWQTVKLGDIADITKLAGYEYTKHVKYSNTGNIIALRVLNIKHNKLLLDNVMYIDNSEFNKLTRSKLYMGDILFTYIGTVGETAIVDKNDKYYLAPNVARIRCNENYNPTFINFLCQTDAIQKTEINRFIATSSQPALSMGSLRQFSISIPTLAEQEKIADHLSTLDNLIDTQIKKLDTFNEHKKGLLQKLLPTDQETTPKYRFPKFKNLEDWQTVKLGDILTYEQPTKYIVESTAYNDKYPIPVLTAGKSLILGNTNETNNIFNNTPVIIFDDFTTSSHYINFEFKIKSSAMKLLTIRSNDNLKFIHESMQLLKFTVKTHKRHWISLYQNLQILLPTIEEQNKIAHCIISLDELINSQTNKIANLRQYKNGLLQKLIPNNERD